MATPSLVASSQTLLRRVRGSLGLGECYLGTEQELLVGGVKASAEP